MKSRCGNSDSPHWTLLHCQTERIGICMWTGVSFIQPLGDSFLQRSAVMKHVFSHLMQGKSLNYCTDIGQDTFRLLFSIKCRETVRLSLPSCYIQYKMKKSPNSLLRYCAGMFQVIGSIVAPLLYWKNTLTFTMAGLQGPSKRSFMSSSIFYVYRILDPFFFIFILRAKRAKS